jgi:aryl-alcohol dehydrogenase-like predicted oxidoreductase
MGMSAFYGPSDLDEVHRTLETALKTGCTFWDTADVYGSDGANEKLIAPYLKEHRDKIFICTKFGVVQEMGNVTGEIRGDAEYVQQACERSLKRLGIPTIDLYYQHRVDPRVPIEETIGAMKKLQEQGKIRYIGMSECSNETLERALKVAHIDALQIEYSPWTLDIETNGILQTCKENNITVVAYSPLGRGMLSGTIRSPSDFASGDFRPTLPRFQGEAFQANLKLVDAISEIARKKGVTPSQLTLAWLLKQSDNVIVIPGTRKVERLMENLGSAAVVVNDEEDAEIRKVIREIDIIGERYQSALMTMLNK